MDARPPQQQDDPAKVAAFEARIAAGETIEPKDWMPERYRRQLVRMMSQHAHSVRHWRRRPAAVHLATPTST